MPCLLRKTITIPSRTGERIRKASGRQNDFFGLNNDSVFQFNAAYLLSIQNKPLYRRIRVDANAALLHITAHCVYNIHRTVTLRENILLGDLSRQDDKGLEQALSQIGAGELKDKLPKGLDTPLGKIRTGAVEVSGGEWQRIAIARLLYSASPINILDEPTAALDPVAESGVYQLFSQVNKGRFTIYITHRLGAAKIADRILVLNQGRIQEMGSHDQLMSLDGGIYQTMFESQKSWYLS